MLTISTPDPKLRQRPLCGLTILWGLRPNGAGHWSNGWLYDPHDGHTYNVTAELPLPTEYLRAFIAEFPSSAARTSLRRRFAGRARKRGPERSGPSSFSLIHFIRGGVPSGSNIDRITAT